MGHRPDGTVKEVDITEWQVPWENTRPRDPYVGPDGRVWFVGQRDDYVASLEPQSGAFARYELEEGAGPHNLIVDEDGFVWYAGNGAVHIGRLDPADGSITRYPMPDSAARDPHTLVFDGNGDIWFTVQNGGFVGKLDVRTGDVQLIAVTAGFRPYGIVIDSDNRPWIAEFGTNKLATVDPGTMELREYDLPHEDSRPRRLEITSDGMVWYVDYSLGFLGRLDPATGAVRQWASPGGARARPYGMAVDDQDRLWFVESGPDPNRFVGFDPGAEQFLSITEIQSGGGTVRHMYFHQPTRTVWFGTDANTIGRARLP
ncbi:MAG: lyase [Gemmatimonadota bacterium]|nr:MAG: lyase [Gemmatimonadota bacterium]